MVTVALGTTAPVESRSVPRMVPVVTCPKAIHEQAKNARRVTTIPDSLLSMTNASQKCELPQLLFFLWPCVAPKRLSMDQPFPYVRVVNRNFDTAAKLSRWKSHRQGIVAGPTQLGKLSLYAA